MPGPPPHNEPGNQLAANPTTGTNVSTAGVTGESNTGPGVLGQCLGLVPPTLTGPGGITTQGVVQPASDGVLGIGKNGVHGQSSNSGGNGVWGEHSGNGSGVAGTSDSGDGVYGTSKTGYAGFFDGKVQVNGATALTFLSVQKPGIPSPPAVDGDVVVGGALSVAGNVQVSGATALTYLSIQKPGIPNPPVVDGDLVVGGTISVAGDIVLTGADFAEDFAVEASAVVEPGAVMVLEENGVLRPCDKAYDRKVAGVISGAGDYRPGLILDRQKFSEGQLPLALVGKVYCKVDAGHGAIEVGDLLTTSPTPGHAMTASDPSRAFGAVLGKALRSMKSGQGMIPILVALQ